MVRNCAKCLERHEAPTGKKCLRLQTPGMQVGSDPVPGPPGLFLPSSEAESVSAEEIRLATVRFPAVSSTDQSTPPRPRGALRAVSFDDRVYDLDGGPDSLETELEPQDNEEDDAADDYDDFDKSEQEGASDQESLTEAGEEGQEEHASNPALSTFNRLASQILDRMERSEKQTELLEPELRVRRELPEAATAPPGDGLHATSSSAACRPR